MVNHTSNDEEPGKVCRVQTKTLVQGFLAKMNEEKMRKEGNQREYKQLNSNLSHVKPVLR